MKAYHRTPIDWHTVTGPRGELLRHEHVSPCGGAIVLGRGGQRRHAHCQACGAQWTRRDARYVWQRAQPVSR